MTNQRGRPRCFDAEAALDRALEVFWRHGFQGASLTELTAAMGVGKPSLYAAFGDKEALYLKALERYATLGAGQGISILDAEPDGRRAVEAYLRAMAAMLTNPALPGGCFVVNGAADCGGAATPPAVEAALHKALQNGEERLRARLARAQREGQLAPDARVDELAAFFSSLLAGLGVLAKSGAKRAKLDGAITAAMAAWPQVPVPRRQAKPRR
jgi:TetR/AcrR family transcriptional regulator, copper-responsive repressor